MTLRIRVETVTQRPRRAQDALCEKRGVDERLTLAREVQEIRRRWIDGARDRLTRERRVATTKPAFVIVVGSELNPRRDACRESPKRFEMRDGTAIGSGCLLDRHARLERAVREVRQHRIGEAPKDVNPVIAIASGVRAGC